MGKAVNLPVGKQHAERQLGPGRSTAMQEHTPDQASGSTVTLETLEAFARSKVQEFIQALLEEEVTALLGRARSQRREEVDAPNGYRNGYGKPRRLSTS